jgi:ABC-2 type transport system permease protein
VSYPYFVDVREDGLAEGDAPTAGLGQLTLSWAAPLKIDGEKAKGRKVTRLIESSPQSAISDGANVLPDFRTHPKLGFAEGREKGRHLLGAMMEGQFTSFFAGKPSPLARDAAPEEANAADAANPGEAAAKDAAPVVTSVIERSPESARIVLVGSGSFLSDEVLELVSSVDRTQYLTPVDFAQNLVDWSLEDRGLLALRSRGGQFSRTLLPMEAGTRMIWEYANYALALFGLGIVYLVRRYRQASAGRRYRAMLGMEGA